MDFVEATHFDEDVTIFTKDGKLIGNGIIYAVTDCNNRSVYHIETDFGNRTKLFWEELEAWFVPGYLRRYSDWLREREEAINAN